MPFDGFANFDACVLHMKGKGNSEADARKMCGAMQAKAEGAAHVPGKGSMGTQMMQMADFNNQWFEIFRAGDYGDKGTWTEADLEKVVSNFATWKPPLVLGHPKEDSPAMGWIKELRVDGPVLLARAEQVQPELEQLAESGRFPNRSAAFYRDPQGSGPVLRHVGFLGATPPEVKGLAPIQFSDGDFVAIEFQEEEPMDVNEVRKTVAMEIRSFFSNLFGEKREPATFTEEQVQQRIDAANKPVIDSMNALTKKFDESMDKSQKRAAAATESEKRAGAVAFVEKMKAAKKWVPAFSEAGLDRVLEDLALAGRSVKFGETGKETEAGAYETFCKFMEMLPEIVPMKEIGVTKRSSKKNVIQFTESRGVVLDEGSLALRDRAIEISETKKIAFGEALRQARAEMGEVAAGAGGMTAGAV